MPTLSEILSERRHRYFTNRETEIIIFQRLLGPTEPEYNILAIYGVGGIGKTTLLEEYRRICKTEKIPVATLDGSEQRDSIEILKRLRDQLYGRFLSRKFSDFDKALRRYIEIQEKLQRRMNIPDALAKLLTLGVKAFPLGGGIIQGISEETIKSTMNVVYQILSKPDVEFFLDAERLLTKRFINGLDSLAHEKRVVIMFDAYEAMLNLEDWMCDKFVPDLSGNIIIVISGRVRLGTRWENWRPMTREVELVEFSDFETQEYLHKRGVTEKDLIDELFKFTLGHPMCLAVSADLKEQGQDLAIGPSSATPERFIVIDTLVDRIMQRITDPLTRKILEGCAVVRFFTKDTLTFILQGEEEVNKMFNELQRYSFVGTKGEQLALHDIVRDYLREDLKKRAPESFKRLNQNAMKWYERRSEGAKGAELQRIVLEMLYHQLVLSEDEGTAFFCSLFDSAINLYQLDFCNMLLNEAKSSLVQRDKNIRWVKFYEALLAFTQEGWEDARSVYQDLLQYPDLDSQLKLRTAFMLGETYYRKGNLDKASRLYAQALDLADKSDDESSVAYILFSLGKVSRLKGKWSKMLKYYEESLDMFQKQREQPGTAQVFLHLGLAYRYRGEWERALKCYSESLQIFQKLADEYGTGKVLFNLGWLYMLQGKWEEAMRHYSRSLEMAREFGAPGNSMVGINLLSIGIVHRHYQQWDKATEYFKQSLEIFQELNDKINVGVVLNNWGILLSCQKKWNEALNYLERCLDIRRQVKDERGAGLTLKNLGDIYRERGEWDSAFAHYRRSLDIMRKHEARYEETMVLASLCSLSYAKSMPNEIREYAERARELATKYNYHDQLAELQIIEGSLQFDNQRYSEAFTSCAQACASALRYNKYFLDRVINQIKRLICKLADSGQGEIAVEFCNHLIHSWSQNRYNDIAPELTASLEETKQSLMLM